MENFLSGHEEAVLTTIIGIISSIYFYYMAKRDGDRTANEYKRHYERAEKEIIELKKKLEESVKANKEHYNISLLHGGIIKNIDEKFASRNNGGRTIEDISQEFFSLLEENKLTEAENYLIGKKPFVNDPSVMSYFEATLKIRRGEILEAIELLDKVTNGEEGSLKMDQIYAIKAGLYSEHLRNPQQALIEWQEAAKIDYKIDYIVPIAFCYMQLKEYGLAKIRLDEAVKINENHPYIWHIYAEYNCEIRNYDLAFEQIERAYSLGLVDPSVFTTKGWIQEANNDSVGALRSYKKALELNPNHKGAIYNLANLHIKLGNLQQAEIELNYYRRKYPDDLYVLGSFFFVLSCTGRQKRVIEIGERLKIVDHVTKCHEAVNTLGISYMLYDEMEKAKDCFESLLAVYPNHYSAFVGLYFVYVNKKCRDLTVAEHYCDKMLEHDPQSVEALNKKGLIYAIRKDFDQAFDLFDEALAINAEDGSTHENIEGVKNFMNFYYMEKDLEKREGLEMPLHLYPTFNNISEEERNEYLK
jgi:Tfp pilus assembly protein PilF